MTNRSRVLGLGVLVGILGAPIVAHAEPMLGLKAANKLVTFDSATPGTLSADKTINGLGVGETVASIDVRPDTGKLYALTNEGNVYTVVVGANDATATKITATALTVTGASFGIDFNPSADRLRVVSNTRQNLRINPNDGTLAGTDPQVFYPLGNCNAADPNNAPQIIGVAYRNNFGGALGFSNAAGDNNGLLQYGIDARTSRLVKMGGASLNDGCVQDIGAGLGVTLTENDLGGFDISQSSGIAYASLNAAGATGLYTINLTTGAATLSGVFPNASGIRDIATLGGPRAAVVYGVTKNNELIRFDAADPTTLTLPATAITGLGAGEAVQGLDFRPKTGELYALAVTGTTAKIYTVNKTTAAATVVGAAGFTVAGASFGFDFNPRADAIRVVSDTGNNYRVAADTGLLAATEVDLSYQDGPGTNPPFGSGVAYTNNIPNAPSTLLYLIDPKARALSTQGALADGGAVDGGPSSGQLYFVAPTGVPTSETGDLASVGFDVAPDGTAYAALTSGAAPISRLYEVVLTPNAGPAVRYGRVIGNLGANNVRDIAIEVPAPAPDGGTDGGGGTDSGTDSGTTPGTDSGTTTPGTDSGTTTPGTDSGTTTPGTDGGVTGDDGDAEGGGCDCSTVPGAPAAPGALALAVVSLYFIRRKRQRG